VNRDRIRLLNPLSRIEGQVRGIAQMINEDRYCIDILAQLQTARAALSRVETELVKDHVAECVRAAITGQSVKEQLRKADELIELLERTTK